MTLVTDKSEVSVLSAGYKTEQILLPGKKSLSLEF